MSQIELFHSFQKKRTYNSAGCYRGKNPDIDCPNAKCPGFLSLYYTIDGNIPHYFVCSFRDVRDEKMRCGHTTMFSKRESVCISCNKVIKEKDIISTNGNNKWVHINCALEFELPPNVFAICLRCEESICNEIDGEVSFNGVIQGHIHVKCGKKRRMEPKSFVEEFSTDSEIQSSQEE
jgi:hypothetical protein